MQTTPRPAPDNRLSARRMAIVVIAAALALVAFPAGKSATAAPQDPASRPIMSTEIAVGSVALLVRVTER
jgi:hypothetical protein